MRRCLYCYNELQEGQTDYHPACCRKIFGQSVPPELPYTHKDIGHLAKQVVLSSITVPGVQAKLSMDIERYAKKGPSRFTIVGLWGRYILKPQTEQFRALPQVEDVTMHLAKAAKIATVPHTLIRFADGELCYLTRRIDRLDGESGHHIGTKLPMEDMCQITERLTEHKYKGSYEQIAKAIRQYSSTPLLDVTLFWEQVLFSWLTGNADMHLKNFSLYEPEPGLIKLTPAYDMLSTALVLPEDTEELALTLNGKKRKLTVHDFRLAMAATGLAEKVIDNVLKRFSGYGPLWNEIIANSFLPKDMKAAYKALVKQRMKMLFTAYRSPQPRGEAGG